uniref:Uncharacterized protein n=1 Tax=Culex quinquefasciatus TaxID=7176 RepID=A0A1S4KH20_CULQU
MKKSTLLVSVILFYSVKISVDAKSKIKTYKRYKAPQFSDAQSNDDETEESKYYVDNEFPMLPGELDLYDPQAPGGLLSQSRPRQPPPSSSPTPSAKPTKPSRKPSRRPKPTGSGRKPDKACDPSKPRRCKVKIVKTENVKIAAPRVTDQGVFPTDAKRSKGPFYDADGKKLDPVSANSRFYVFGKVNRKRVLKEEEVDHLEGDSYAFNHDAKVSGLTVEISVTLYTESSLQLDVYSNGTKKLTFRTGKDDIASLELKWYG